MLYLLTVTIFSRYSEGMTVLDNASWHIDDAQEFEHAATHISLYYVWLINKGFMVPDLIAEHGFTLPLPTDHTPNYYFEKFADFKLVSDDFTTDGQKRYANQKKYTTYLEDTGSNIIEYARIDGREPQYNIVDNWDNVKVLDDYFNTMGFILGPRRLIAKAMQKLDEIESRTK